MNTDAVTFFIYLFIFWVVLFILHKLFKLERYQLEFKPYLVILWRTRRLNSILFKIAMGFRGFWKIVFTVGIFLAIGETLFTLNFLLGNLISYYYRVGEVQPVIPLIPGITFSLNSLPYFIISIVLVFIFHEFAHGIAAFAENLTVKNVGLLLAVFVGGGFVELDENDMNSASFISKLRILSSGSTANLVTGILSLFMIANFSFVISPFYGSSSGVIVVEVINGSPASLYGVKNGDILFYINGVRIYDSLSFSNVLSNIPANSTVVLNTARGDLIIVGGAHPINPSKVFLGIRVFNYYPPKIMPFIFTPEFPYHYYNFLNWFEVISLSAAFINMLPIPFFDGGRFFEVLLRNRIINSKKALFKGREIGVGELILEILKFTSLTFLLLNISQSLFMGSIFLR
ncbi:MAG: site-2 protease family protein [Candidatus Methanomethylicia archaeon]